MAGAIAFKKISSFTSLSASRLKAVWKPLWRVLTFSPADERILPAKNLTLSIDKGAVFAAYGTRFLSHLMVQSFRTYSFQEDQYPQPDVFASTSVMAIKEMGIKGKDITLSIPKSWVVFKTAEFPVAVKENLSNVVSYELDRLTPFGPEDAFYDFRIVREDAERIVIMVVAVRADMIKPYLDALKEVGVSVSRISVNILNAGALCCYANRGTGSFFVEISAGGYEGVLFNGPAATSFSGNFVSDDDKSKADAIMREVMPAAEELKKKGRQPQIMLHMKDSNPSLKEILKVNMPVKFIDETDIRLNFSGHRKEMPYSAVGGVLTSLRRAFKGFNLLTKGVHEKTKTPVLLTILLAIAIIAIAAVYAIAPVKIEKERLAVIDKQVALKKDEVKKVEALKTELEALNRDVSVINNFKGQKPPAQALLKELTVSIPDNSWLTRSRITDKTVEIEGYSDSATGLLSKLEASKYFQKAEFASPTFRDVRLNADRFIIKMEIEGIKKPDVEASKDEKK